MSSPTGTAAGAPNGEPGQPDNQASLGSGYKLPKLHWKGEKSKECELGPSVSSQEAKPSMGEKREKRKKGKKVKISRKKGKKICFTRSVHGVFSSWQLDPGQVSRFFSQVTPGERALASVTRDSGTLDSVTMDSVTLLPRSHSSCALSSFVLSLEPRNSSSPWRDLGVR